MKRNLILILPLLLIAVVGCKKYNDYSHQVGAPADTTLHEKKWVVSTVAGDGRPVFGDGPVMIASFRAPLDVAVGADGAIYVADAINHRIRKITNGQVFTFVGTGAQDTTSGSALVAKYSLPSYLAFDPAGNLCTLDNEDSRVRIVSPAGFVSVVAGKGVIGFADGRADTAKFGNECSGIATDESGNIYVVDWKNRRIRKVSAAGEVSTIAGNGIPGSVDGDANIAEFFNPGGIVIDRQGNLFVGDQNRIRKISANGIVTTFAGRDSTGYRDGPAQSALFSAIVDLVIDEQGNIYASDDDRIRRITPQGVVSTLAGSIQGYNDGDAASARFNRPTGLGIDRQGNIYVADDFNNRIRKISFE